MSGGCRPSGSTYPAMICDNVKPDYPHVPGWVQGAVGGAIANAGGGVGGVVRGAVGGAIAGGVLDNQNGR